MLNKNNTISVDIHVFTSPEDTDGAAKTTTWGSIVRTCLEPKLSPSKESCKLLKLAKFGDDRNGKSSLRNRVNMLSVSGVEIDYDAGQLELSAAAKVLARNGIECVLYTSASHQAFDPNTGGFKGPRWRILAPFSKPLTPDQRAKYVGIINALLDGVLARESFEPQQPFYYGRVTGAEYEAQHVPGACIDTLDWIHVEPVFPENFSTAPRAELADPRLKSGAIGAFCRKFTATEAIAQFLPHIFEQVEGTRYSWVGHDNPGGVFVTDDDQHIGAAHDSWPFGTNRCANTFDVVRKFLFDPENLEDPLCPPGSTDSFREMLKFVEDELELDTDEEPPEDIVAELAGEAGEPKRKPTWEAPTPLTPAEAERARLAPTCLVENYLYADVGVVVAPGGVGKTSLMLYEAIHIALGLPLWGKRVVTPGPVLIITAEDDRELMAARLREIARTMMLNDEQMQTIWRDVLISDVSGQSRKLTVVKREVVMISEFTHDLVTGIRAMARKPVLIVIDPAVSFGVGESRVNDAEQGLVEAARLLKREFGVAVRYIHHSGKANGREKALDQYAGRGGSAFADGARMVYVMAAFGPGDAADWAKLTGSPLLEGESGIVLATPKLSYTAAQPHIYIKRLRFGFQQIEVIPEADKPVVTLDEDADKLLSWLGEQLAVGIYHTRKTAEDVAPGALGFKRARLRECMSYLQAMQKVREDEKPLTGGEKPKRGGAFSYINPIGFNGWKGGEGDK